MRFDVAVLLNVGLLLLSCVHQSKGQIVIADDDGFDDNLISVDDDVDSTFNGKIVDRWASAGGGWR